MVARETTGKDFLILKHFSRSMNSELDLILRSCSSLALFWRRSYTQISMILKPSNSPYLVRHLPLTELPVEEVDALLDLADLLHQPVVGRVPAQLHVRPVGPAFNN